ncbi:MAG TPA: hypothetical protein PKD24_02015 [Pyrinomonadaceae bacterium]|nr:hypothetical protein [Pyrinomonadaceae bacterium]HMP64066.1 hypothetical protein [Pyrinomonadaceae bacterium]
MAERINIEQLRKHAPNNPILAFSPANTGSPMQDWCSHLAVNPLRRRELEEFAILGDVVVRIADELEPEALDRVRIMSLEYAMKVLNDETDAKEFVKCVKAIASPDAGQYEFEQIAAYYYGEIRRRGVSEVLMEMGLLGMQLEAVTATVSDREIDFEESKAIEQKLCVADQRRVQEAAKNRQPLPPKCPNFDDEMRAVLRRVGRQKISRMIFDDFADFYLEGGDKSIEELDRDFTTFEQLEQFDENGLIGITMSSSQRSVVVFDLDCEIDADCLPGESRKLYAQIPKLFVGHSLGGCAVQEGRRIINCAGWSMPSRHPFSDQEFGEWMALSLDRIYDRKVIRSARRIYSFGKRNVEILVDQEINPDFDEMQYAASVLRLLWQKQYSDFHLRSLRHDTYQETYIAIRGTSDTAEVADLKKKAYANFKDQKKLTLKEFTALNTVAKSQEVRLKDQFSKEARQWLRKVESATPGQIRFLKFALYNDAEVKAFKRQEKQKLWDAVRAREAELKNVSVRTNRLIQTSLFTQPSVQRNHVQVIPSA